MTTLHRALFLWPILYKSLVRSIIESDDLKWNALIDDHATQEHFHRLCHVEAKSMKDFLGRVFNAWGDAHL